MKNFCFAIAILDQSYWVIGSFIAAGTKSVLAKFSAEGIGVCVNDRIVYRGSLEQWMEKKNRFLR